MRYKSVKEVASYVKDVFKLEPEFYDIVRNSAEALKLLKMFAIGHEVTFTTIENFCVHLPSVYDVRAVIRLEAPALTSYIEVQDITFPPQIVFEMPEEPTSLETVTYKHNYVPDIRGPYIDFVWDCPHLRFNEDKVWVAIECLSIKKDKENLPMIPEPAFFACAYYCAYVHQLPLLYLGKIEPNVFAKIEELKNNKFAQARAERTLQALTKNEADKLFNIMSSMDRKAFNFPV